MKKLRGPIAYCQKASALLSLAAFGSADLFV
jgi:hypothetical protein